MLPIAQAQAAMRDVANGTALPPDILEYFVGRGFVEAVKPGTDEAVPPGTEGAEIRLTDAGKACMHGEGV
ncbi:hypothetical protein GN316_16550 [Xylophilus sp. Kf1]|nr:hypothetical protein [Xylophilus sp. Kf1]